MKWWNRCKSFPRGNECGFRTGSPATVRFRMNSTVVVAATAVYARACFVFFEREGRRGGLACLVVVVVVIRYIDHLVHAHLVLHGPEVKLHIQKQL